MQPWESGGAQGRILRRLYRRLEPLRLYRLRGQSLIDCELAAYAAGLELLEIKLREVHEQAFVQTAEGEGLSRHERLVGLQERPGLDEESRRELVLYRLAVAPFDFHLQGMHNSVRAAGIDARITEHFAEERLSIRSNRLIDETLDTDTARARLSAMLPAHLDFDFDFGDLTWNLFEHSDVCWKDWDGLDFSWEEFDLNGQNLFSGGND